MAFGKKLKEIMIDEDSNEDRFYINFKLKDEYKILLKKRDKRIVSLEDNLLSL